MSDPETRIPMRIRLRLARAAVQALADAEHVDVLHLKGDAVDSRLRPPESVGTDVDVLVRPEHLERFDRALREHGWSVYSSFDTGSPFGHAQTYLHPLWGYLDAHRHFPGVRVAPGRAFDTLWRDRATMAFGSRPCPVPAVPAQAAILVLNAARSRALSTDVRVAWTDAAPAERAALEAVVAELDAGTAFAAATGRLEERRRERDYLLWRTVSAGGSRFVEWYARARAAPTFREGLRVLLRAPLVNVDHLAHELGREPTRREVVREFFARPLRGIRELVARPAERRRG